MKQLKTGFTKLASYVCTEFKRKGIIAIIEKTRKNNVLTIRCGGPLEFTEHTSNYETFYNLIFKFGFKRITFLFLTHEHICIKF